MRARRIILAGLGAVMATASVASPAQAVTFGADVNAPSNNTATCGSAFGTSSCSFYSGLPGPTFYAPASGTVTAVRVKTGNFPQGPMQVVVMYSLYQNHAGDPGHPYYACCFVAQYGPTFTPGQNTVTTVPTSLPMIEQPTPPPDDYQTNARGDFLMLSVLTGNVPIPANLDGSSFYSYFAPAPNPNTTPAPSPNPIFGGNGQGAHLALSADLNTSGPAVAPPIAPATIGPKGPLGIGAGRAVNVPGAGQLLGNTASIPIQCVLTTACDGSLQLFPVGAHTAKAKGKGNGSFGSTHFTIPGHSTKSVKVRLNAAGKKALGKHSSLTATATLTIAGKTFSARVTLKKKKKKKK